MHIYQLALLAQGQAFEWDRVMHPMWWWGGMMLMMIIFLGLIIGGIVFAIRWLIIERTHRPDGALAILRERYSKGEINKEEFEAKKRDLS